jgi:exodeoxyribonuclease VII large subunit
VPNQSSPTVPFSVSFVAQTIQGWIERLGEIWVEGEIIQFNKRPNAAMQYLTLRDLKNKDTVSITIWSNVLAGIPLQPEVGNHVLIRAKPSFYPGNSSFS